MSKHALRVTTLLVSAALAQHAYASGFQFSSQSAANQATANSSAAEVVDASTISYNPAGLSYLEGNQFSGTLTVVSPSIKAKNAQATTPLGNKITDGNGNTITNDSIGDPAAAPHAYLSSRLSDKVGIGLGVYVPFGSGTDYERNSVLRYNVNQTMLKVLALNPAMSLKLTPKVSVGFGVIAQHADAELRQYANFASSMFGGFTRQAAQLNAAGDQAAANGNAAAAAALYASADQMEAAAGKALAQDGKGPLDGYAEINGDDWGFGFNFGALWDVSDSTRVGFSYRSKVKHELRGTADWTLPTGAAVDSINTNLTPLGTSVRSVVENSLGYVDSAASVAVTTPESFSLHLMQQVNPATKLYADISYTKHSSFTQADVIYAVPKVTIDTSADGKTNFTRLQPKWKNTTKIALGGSYQFSDALQLRAGLAHDKSPVPSENDRLSTLPDSDRTWLSLGGKYAFNKSLTLDAAYTYIMIKDASAKVNGYCGGTRPDLVAYQNNPSQTPGAVNCVSSYTAGTVDFDSSAHLIGLQASYRF
ncbi:OmpP1/FadL family transporter [Chitinimonas taiwanensis]|uniref:Long-chain fatty acid transport protein n=1 Tax=Chitinimonas taiwanensis DSM 18899 TaxID=1121279 RepID=A0A1K2HAT0_9NEIS|nr:OmpP1/FadL family transporter [Chitinimonas taiwanensis]SFZ73789.1 long-chain fatty acid transport protein [Chitinimonas taiwanensis DSM 18899]